MYIFELSVPDFSNEFMILLAHQLETLNFV